MKGLKKIVAVFILFLILFITGCITPVSTYTSPVTIPPLSPNSITVPQTSEIQPFSTIVKTAGTMMVSYIDVGQGDSELIQTPSGKIMLIDAGPTDAGQKVENFLRNQKISTIDIVVATHPHEDHIGGMSTILNSFSVKQFIDSGYPHTTSTYEGMLNLIDQKNISFRTVNSGDTFLIDPAISIQVLNPQATFFDDINQNSIVLKMTYGTVSFLFTGDAGSSAESIYTNAAGHADVLKVAHHGSSTSTGEFFLSKVTPMVSIIEVGSGNPYGHPADATIQRLRLIGSTIYRTDLHGTIQITCDGNTYHVITEKNGSEQ